jgi:hypothetical protein
MVLVGSEAYAAGDPETAVRQTVEAVR